VEGVGPHLRHADPWNRCLIGNKQEQAARWSNSGCRFPVVSPFVQPSIPILQLTIAQFLARYWWWWTKIKKIKKQRNENITRELPLSRGFRGSLCSFRFRVPVTKSEFRGLRNTFTHALGYWNKAQKILPSEPKTLELMQHDPRVYERLLKYSYEFRCSPCRPISPSMAKILNGILAACHQVQISSCFHCVVTFLASFLFDA